MPLALKIHTSLVSWIVQDWKNEFIMWMHHRKLSPLTIGCYARTMNEFCRFLEEYWGHPLDHHTLTNLTLADIRAYLSKRHRAQISKATQGVLIAGIKMSLKFWMHKGYGLSVSLNSLRRPKMPRTLPKPLDQSAIQTLMTNPPTTQDWVAWRDYALCVLLYATGMRIQEALSLTRGQIAQDVVYITGKRSKERVIPLLPVARTMMLRYLNLCPYPGDEDSFVFLGAKGKRLQPALFQRRMAQWRQQFHLPLNTTPHSLRHSFASHLLEQAVHVRDVQDLLGHSSLSSTQRYVQATRTHLQDLYTQAHPLFQDT